jgi:hypothetical protein
MTILVRLEKKPGVTLTVCGMVSQQWLDGLLSGEIAKAQGGLTQGQLGWLETHRQHRAADAAPPAPSAPRPGNRGARTSRKPPAGKFDLVDTEEL